MTRKQIINKAKKQREEIRLYFNTVEHWNNSVRKPDEQPIEADPDGKLTSLAAALDKMLAKESASETQAKG